ncbi:MAG: hypothetical protein JW830_12830 [Bacteroidales bacterium]|nr:hypothetical protein [Bacteroidales bacterium]
MNYFKSVAFILFAVNGISLAQTGSNPLKINRSDSYFGVHFDLHAGEDITDAGRTLTYAMIDTFLTRVRPDFIQIDCKGHPGISSYPTKVGFHVNGFEKDPLKLWREVSEKNKVGLYMHFSGIWDEKVVEQHPEWAVIKANGERSTRKVSFFSPYLDTYMIPQLKELSRDYHVDGAWIDGECWAVEPDYGEASLKRFTRETGITEIPRTMSDKYYPDFMEYTRRLFREHLKRYTDAIHQFNPDFQITSNWAYSSMMPEKVSIPLDFLSGDVTPQNGVYRAAFEARCLASQGKPWDLMAWGFSWNGSEMPMSVKSALQLKQEAAEIIAMGGGVQFYFQQNRDLSLKPWLAYLLSDVGKFCRERQTYCHKAVPISQAALLYPSLSYQKSSPVPYSRSLNMLQGTLNALLDGQLAVEVMMEHHLSDRMNQYPLIIIPECDYLDPSFLEELRTYTLSGGNLLIIGTETAKMFKDELNIRSFTGIPESEAFITASHSIGSVRSDLLHVELGIESRPLSKFYKGSDFSYPSEIISSSVNIYGKGKVAGIYFNAGSCYAQYKTHIIRDFLTETVQELFPVRLVEISGSHLIHVAVNSLHGKMYINLVNAAGEHTNANAIGFDVIPPLLNIGIAIKSADKPLRILQQPGGKELKISEVDGRWTVMVPELQLHEILEVIY